MDILTYESKIESSYNYGDVNEAIRLFDCCINEYELDKTIRIYEVSSHILHNITMNRNRITDLGIFLDFISDRIINCRSQLDYDNTDLAILYNNLSVDVLDIMFNIIKVTLQLYDNTVGRNLFATLFPLVGIVSTYKSLNSQKEKLLPPYYRLASNIYKKLDRFVYRDDNMSQNINNLKKVLQSKESIKYGGGL